MVDIDVDPAGWWRSQREDKYRRRAQEDTIEGRSLWMCLDCDYTFHEIEESLIHRRNANHRTRAVWIPKDEHEELKWRRSIGRCPFCAKPFLSRQLWEWHEWGCVNDRIAYKGPGRDARRRKKYKSAVIVERWMDVFNRRRFKSIGLVTSGISTLVTTKDTHGA